MKKVIGGVKVFVIVFVIGVLSISLISSFFSSPLFVSSSDSQESSLLNYRSFVCVYKNGEVVDCSHNLLYNSGRNITRNSLGIGGNSILNISIMNASAVATIIEPNGNESFTQYINCELNNTAGTYATLQNAPGNWTVTKTFTSACDNVNTTAVRLVNATGSLFAGNSFTLVTLQTNDQLTINWTLMIT